MTCARPVVLLLCSSIWLVAPACASPDEPAVGSTHWVGTQYFQYLGQSQAGRDLWLYPHLDGVLEWFSVETERWSGSLGSLYDPVEGRFLRRFDALDALNDLLAKGAPTIQKTHAAGLLARFASLHPAENGPFYLQPARRALRKYLGDDGATVAEVSRRTHERLLSRVAHPGTRILPEPAALRSSDDHYRSLVGDGYLDIAVVGGNSENTETGELHSAGMAGDLLDALRRQGFVVGPRGPERNQADCERTVELFGHQVRVRVRLTSAAREGAAIRRTVANFVEGLAQADVVIYYGHSNKGSGYYLAENKDAFSRFGLDSSDEDADLATKFHGLGKKTHQILALHSCLSYARYCTPIRTFYDEDATTTAPGFVGTARRVPITDFAPRFAKFVELLTRGAGPRELSREVNAIRPSGPDSSELLFRGVLQPRHSFVVPHGVTIEAVAAGGPKQGFLVKGTGSDGVVYDSTGVFPQDQPGEIVQVVPGPAGVYGVSRDGRLLSVSRESVGAPVELVTPQNGRRIVFAAWAKRNGRRRLYLLGSDGQLRHLSRKGDRLISPRHDPPPAGVHLVAIGNAADGRFVALDAAGRAYASSSKRWEPLVEIDATPSLWGDSELSFGE